MKLSNFTKGIIMAIIALVATTITTTGLPATGIQWEILGITAAGTTLIYVAKNAVLPSISLFGTIDVQDVFSGLVMAVGSGISEWAAAQITTTPVNWHDLLTLMGSVAVAYLAKKFATQPKTTTITTRMQTVFHKAA